MDARARLIALLRERSIKSGSFVLASGRRSSWYVDCRRTTMHAEGLALVGDLGLAKVREAGWTPDAIGGLTMGADPVAYAIARASHGNGAPIHGFSVRKNLKTHGTGRLIEGCFEPGHKVVVVEDVITSGGSALEAVRAVGGEGGIVLGVLAIVDREEGGRAAIEDAGLHVESLLRMSDLVDA